jgi:hypothetical protein
MFTAVILLAKLFAFTLAISLVTIVPALLWLAWMAPDEERLGKDVSRKDRGL